MDATQMDFPDACFDCVVDKGMLFSGSVFRCLTFLLATLDTMLCESATTRFAMLREVCHSHRLHLRCRILVVEILFYLLPVCIARFIGA